MIVTTSNVMQQKLAVIVGGNANNTAALDDSLSTPYKMEHTLTHLAIVWVLPKGVVSTQKPAHRYL